MLSAEAERFIDEMANGPAFWVAGAIVLAHPQINNKLKAEARRFQEGKDYAPHKHLEAVVEGFLVGITSDEEAPGKAEHDRLRVSQDLIYTVGATLLVLGVRYQCWKMMSEDESLPREVLTELENAFDRWLIQNELDEYAGQAWPSHGAAVNATFIALTPTSKDVTFFWQEVIKPLGQPELTQQLRNAFVLLAPPEFAEVYIKPQTA